MQTLGVTTPFHLAFVWWAAVCRLALREGCVRDGLAEVYQDVLTLDVIEETLRFIDESADFGDELMRFDRRIRDNLAGLTDEEVTQVVNVLLDAGYDIVRHFRADE